MRLRHLPLSVAIGDGSEPVIKQPAVSFTDPTGEAIGVLAAALLVVGAVFLALSVYQFIQRPSWANAGWVAFNAITLPLGVVKLPFAVAKAAMIAFGGSKAAQFAKNLVNSVRLAASGSQLIASEAAALRYLAQVRGLNVWAKGEELARALGRGSSPIVDFFAETPIGTFVLNEAKQTINSNVLREFIIKADNSSRLLDEFLGITGHSGRIAEIVLTAEKIAPGALGGPSGFFISAAGFLYKNGRQVIVNGAPLKVVTIPF